MSELSYENKRKLLIAALGPDENFDIWIKDLYIDRVIVDKKGALYEIPYSIVDGLVTLGEWKEVKAAYHAMAEMKDVEILETGTHIDMEGKKVTVTGEDLDDIIENEKKLEELVKPPFVCTHEDGTDATVQVFKSVNGGIFHNLRKSGKKLLADIKNMPKKVIDVLNEVKEFRLSSEFYGDFKHDGKSYGNTLCRVSWVPIPAIKTLKSATADNIVNLFAEKRGQETFWIMSGMRSVQNKTGKEKDGMDKDDVSKFQEQLNKFQETITGLNGKVTKLEEENTDLRKERDDTVKKLSEQGKKDLARKVKEMVKPYRTAGLNSATADKIEAFAENLENEVIKFGEKEFSRVDAFARILSDVSKRDESNTLIVPFGEMTPGGGGNAGAGGYEDKEAVKLGGEIANVNKAE